MQMLTQGSFLMVRLDREEKVMESLTRISIDKQFPAAAITGLGALKKTKLGFYVLEDRRYDEKIIEDDVELLSLCGNISWMDKKPIVHCHVVLGDRDFRCHGGHLFEGSVAVTVELMIRVSPQPVARSYNPDIGLNHLSCAMTPKGSTGEFKIE